MTNIKTENTRDALITDFGKSTLSDRYLLPGETYQGLFARVAHAYQDDDAHGQRVYNYMSRHWFLPATPILSNGGANRGLPISCFLNETDDKMAAIRDLWSENVDLASNGGGIGSFYGNVRSIGEKVGKAGKTSGVIPFIKVQDSMTLAVAQGSLRRGSSAVYLPVWHPEIEEFIEIRRPTGGDPNRKCLNIHHGVVIDDAFMQAVESGADYDLKSPHDGSVIRSVSARSLWIRILTARLETGEPFLLFSDTVKRSRPDIYKRLGLDVKTSNLCVAGDTRILTSDGYKEIETLAGQDVTLWNGEEWSNSRVEKTSDNAKMRKIEFSNGAVIWATDEHKFYVQKGARVARWYVEEKRAHELEKGDKIVKSQFPLCDTRSDVLPFAYTNGFHTADGSMQESGSSIIPLCGRKTKLLGVVSAGVGKPREENSRGEIALYFPKGILKEKFFVPHDYCVESKLEWFAGLIDGDGSVNINGKSRAIHFTSINLPFMNEVRLFLNSLGVDVVVSLQRKAHMHEFSDHKGGISTYWCQNVYVATMTATDTQKLVNLGLKTHRLVLGKHTPSKDSKHFVTVVSNGTEFKEGPTYCAHEPKRHRIMLEGILTGNCNEIVLTTGKDHTGTERTAVCNLSSLNLETWDEWHDNPQFIEDIMRFLDNVLQDFIDRAPDTMARAKYAAMRERSVGLGVMGFHSFLQARGIPYESVMAKVWNKRIFKHIREQADAVSVTLANERGACPDAIEAGINERFTHKLAVAPTASISIIAGTTSPGIDPITANVYLQKTLSGSFSVRNRHLAAVLERYGRNDDATWSDITVSKGSVQHLDFLSQHERDVFKTAFELDQRWVIEHAADRAGFICQGASNNLWLPADIHKRDLHEIHMQAWKKGVKGLYYLRSLSIQRADTVSKPAGVAADNVVPQTEPKYDECAACQ